MRATSAARRPRVHVVVAGWLASAVVFGGCGIQAETEATVVGPAPDVRAYEDPSGPPEPRPGGSADEEVPALHQVALLDADDALVYRVRPDDGSPDLLPHRVLTALLAPLTPDETAAGLSSAVPVGTWVQDAFPTDLSGAHVIVRLSAEFDAGGTDLEIERRIQQVACSLHLNAGGYSPDGAADLELVELHIDGRSPEDARFVTHDELAACP